MKHIDRRKFLLGTGGGMMALPWLEMYAEEAATKKLKEPSLRFASFYSPMGFVRGHFCPGEGKNDADLERIQIDKNAYKYTKTHISRYDITQDPLSILPWVTP